MIFTRLLIFICIAWRTLGYSQHTLSPQVSKFTIEALQLGTDKQIWIYLPKDYSENSAHYPTLYMQDAQNLFDAATSYAGEWEIDEYLDANASNNAIIIGIEHGNEKRMSELTPYPNESYGGGNADAYLEFIIHTLKPHIDSTYRTLENAKSTSIFGSSLGGLLLFYAILKHPEVFGSAGVFSASFWFNPEIFDVVAASQISKNSRFYFLAGSAESDTMVPDQEKMVSLLLEKGVPQHQLTNIKVEGGQHNEALWRENFGQAFIWLMSE
ncbi:alpha/beta hydrolase [Gelidibacter salicanalis]|uniref:Alpha/beta hydrolase n=1 Tax=Gelidibacter salicanalis TaxID=291193 RepID=A0A5C7ANE4_9FLAO|nr:alpha/beta hydrolase-fold protein [Gelidibacter salicanalis]TXE09484.1 alpha/beta hydrolase [Gelidibacter salicanalis]